MLSHVVLVFWLGCELDDHELSVLEFVYMLNPVVKFLLNDDAQFCNSKLIWFAVTVFGCADDVVDSFGIYRVSVYIFYFFKELLWLFKTNYYVNVIC